MKILALDTSTRFMCLGLLDGSKIYEYNLETGRKLSSLLTVSIKRVLDTLGWRVNDIDYFACGLGPGSFTGIRVGVATIKAMSWIVNKPVVGICSLDILAGNVKDTDKPIIPVVDAKRNLIYTSIFKKKNGRLKRTKPYMLLNEEEFIAIAPARSIIFADALELYKEKLMRNLKEPVFLDRDYWYPKAHNIIELALERIKGKRWSSAFSIKPVYLYPKECQIKR
ncbi:MAG: tRNA (adenosine(37)-N6)-threonylcarbamoyltransferase complex dimerization subunit type 1 TsaB [Candidatus Omnitrophica bacterium]|nr:tRNA (adenosine(37)-N6)-threonylcarbamoyltransferase complex dimerization subunit type 1 TsaB [Candidatus Omnitrophota bacterium]